MRNDRRPWERKKKQSHSERRRKESFCIFTEGKTEQLYFDDFNLPILRVKCVGLGGGNAEHLLNEVRVNTFLAEFFDTFFYLLNQDLGF